MNNTTELYGAKQRCGLTYRQISEKTGLQISNICRSVKRPPHRSSLGTYVLIAIVLGISEEVAHDTWKKSKVDAYAAKIAQKRK